MSIPAGGVVVRRNFSRCLSTAPWRGVNPPRSGSLGRPDLSGAAGAERRVGGTGHHDHIRLRRITDTLWFAQSAQQSYEQSTEQFEEVDHPG